VFVLELLLGIYTPFQMNLSLNGFYDVPTALHTQPIRWESTMQRKGTEEDADSRLQRRRGRRSRRKKILEE
jgi:hypothetical protein